MGVKIAVLGGGVIGVTTAWYLMKAGCEVTVIERQPGAGLETSYANAGEISPGYSTPWAGPGVPAKAVKWLMMEHGPLVIRPQVDPAQWRWMLQMLRNCTTARYHVNKTRMMRVANYSRDMLQALRAETGIAYDERTLGTLQVFRTQKQLDGIGEDVRVLKEMGVPFEVLDPAGCVGAEPALARVKDLLVGGLRLPADETGDCHMFTQRLAHMAADRGVSFRYGTGVKALLTDGDRVTGVETTAGRVTADAYVAALGSYSPLLLKTLGIRVPVYPVKGYSLTIPITNSQLSPISTVMDETYKVAITRLGDRIRVGGTAELSGYNDRLDPKRRATLEKSVGDLFPEGGDLKAASFWSGLRPMTPDGTPVIGGTRYRNLHLNTGHGTLGWTMACGSGRVMADLVTGRTPEIATDDLAVARYA
ncbi:D-amino acid dehydrogenase [Chthonobacter rhizosphaerae]|uniref:D-amino acid dehydrogenase n=1 Tax=Chthonobacter rhizosphaerae TaxID=2735553 RepID=UPI001AED7603|nr:D-amino acid dehydrogenase [Chthonobacter rhizosphaerae]